MFQGEKSWNLKPYRQKNMNKEEKHKTDAGSRDTVSKLLMCHSNVGETEKPKTDLKN